MADLFDDTPASPSQSNDPFGDHTEVTEEVIEGDANDLLDGNDVTITEEIYEGAPPASVLSPQAHSSPSPASPGFPSSPQTASSKYSIDTSSMAPSNYQSFTFLQDWQVKHEEHLQQKARTSEEKHREIVDEAQKSIEKFYKERAAKKEKSDSENKTSETQFIASRDSSINPEGSWEAVTQLVDMQAKPIGKDTSRMRGILVQMKH
eukprot:TRINITY_DN651_c0_g1_i1.p1 TRINITY_DN651_c0_g1~~TRINITY_DN651_c0_g1_i1.p1  ORF type:complete len:206 (+),score=67.42 TRINITY_DN651_c0_g1_i1:53-670(+)